MQLEQAQSMSAVYNLGLATRVPPGEGRTFIVEGRTVAVFRTRTGALLATQAECPHQRGPLADGLLGDNVLVCPLHGYKFDVKTGLAVGHSCGSLKTYPVELSDRGEILLRVEDS
ncbi:Rieske (2Fe-2S) protein [Cystobacter fuscus]|uniref:Rieske (2Fe-2S) protein n=1 Tax=Cystobacter fuscus TaxID=43 RepID=UPI0037C15632